jgi:hypothetical protein
MSRAIQAIFERAEARGVYASRARKSAPTPEYLKKSGRIFFDGKTERATYIGRNAGSVCEICGCDSPALPDISKKWLRNFCLALARKRYHKLPLRKDKPCMKHPQEYATKLAKLPDRIAAVLAESVAVKGDAWTLDDSQALVEVMDIINEIDDTAIPRMAKAKKKRLPRRKSG